MNFSASSRLQSKDYHRKWSKGDWRNSVPMKSPMRKARRGKPCFSRTFTIHSSCFSVRSRPPVMYSTTWKP